MPKHVSRNIEASSALRNGLSDPRMTRRYAHLLPENQSMIDRIDGMGTTTILRQSQRKERPETGHLEVIGVPSGIRTPVIAVKGQFVAFSTS